MGLACSGEQLKPCLFKALAAIALISTFASNAQSSEKAIYIKSVYALPATLDPAQMSDLPSLGVSELIYDGLLRLTNDYSFEASLAKSWVASSDGKTITFKLREDAVFQTGDPVTAADVVESLKRYVAPKSRAFSYYEFIEGADDYHSGKSKELKGLVALDKTTIQFKLTKSFPALLYVLAGATAKVMPAKLLLDETKFFAHPVGSGPFKFDRYETIQGVKSLVLKRFDRHPRMVGNIDELVLLPTSEEKAKELALAGVVDDLASWPLTKSDSVFSDGQHINSSFPMTWIIGLNLREKPFDNLKARAAFRDSIDVEKFRTTFHADADPALGYIPPGLPGEIKTKSAKKIAPIIAPKEPVVLLIPKELADGDKIASFFTDQLKKNGWTIRSELVPWSEMVKRYDKKSAQAFLMSMNIDYPDAEFLLRNFVSTNPDNFSGLKDSKLDDLLEKARLTVEKRARERLYIEASERLNELVPTVNLFHPRAHVWVSNCVKNFSLSLIADSYIDYAKTSIDPACKKKIGANK